jgi:predicted nicotinamide N-methyase
MAFPDKAEFIRAHTRLLAVPHAPEIRLYLADEATALWEKTEEELGEMGLPPPFWAFAWAGGQALARYVLDHPTIARGERVLDFASGSGLVAIAAALAGAASVEGSEIDQFALASIALNAEANGVAVTPRGSDIVGQDEGWTLVLAGDVSYERDLAERVTDWLAMLAARGAHVLIGDPGRTYLARDRLEAIAEYRIPVTRALEDMEVKQTQVWAFRGWRGNLIKKGAAMQPSDIKAGHCYATAENQHRKVTRIEAGKVWYQTYRADVPGTWAPAHPTDAAPSLDAFVAEVTQEVPCVESARVGTGG